MSEITLTDYSTHQPVFDCRGKEITVGCKIVTAISSDRLMERTVTKLERPGKPDWWVNVRCGGFWTTPDRCAVVE